MARKNPIPWQRVRADWDAGILQPAAIVKKHGIAYSTLVRKHEAEGWPPHGNKRKTVDDATLGKLARAAVNRLRAKDDAQSSATAEVLDVYADLTAAVVEKHKTRLAAGMELGESMRLKLKGLFDDLDRAIEESVKQQNQAHDEQQARVAGAREKGEEGSGLLPGERFIPKVTDLKRLRMKLDAMDKAADVFRRLVQCEADMVRMERQAWGLQTDGSSSPQSLTYDDIVAEYESGALEG